MPHNNSQDDSRRHPGSPVRNYETTCSACGTKYIAKAMGCPTCNSRSGQQGDELTKKVMDPPDLIK